MPDTFQCKECGQCCNGNVPVPVYEFPRLVKAVSDFKEFRFTPKFDTMPWCPFLDFIPGTVQRPSLCMLYDDRPIVCKMFKCDYEYTPDEAKELIRVLDVNRKHYMLSDVLHAAGIPNAHESAFARFESRGFDWEISKTGMPIARKRPDVLRCVQMAFREGFTMERW